MAVVEAPIVTMGRLVTSQRIFNAIMFPRNPNICPKILSSLNTFIVSHIPFSLPLSYSFLSYSFPPEVAIPSINCFWNIK